MVGGWPVPFTELTYISNLPKGSITLEEPVYPSINPKPEIVSPGHYFILFANWLLIVEYDEFFLNFYVVNVVVWILITSVVLKVYSKRKFFWKNRKKIAKVIILFCVLLSILFVISYIQYFRFKNKKASPFIESCNNLNGKLLTETTITDSVNGYNNGRSDLQKFNEYSIKKSLETREEIKGSVNIHEAKSNWFNLNYWVCRIENDNGVLKTKAFYMH